MSLVSASSFVGGIKEYLYRGFQQLPLVLAMTSFVFTVTTGSVAHTTMFTGLVFIMPLFTVFSQELLKRIAKNNNWKRSNADSCNVITDYKSLKDFGYYVSTDMNNWNNIPSYWLTSISFFFGYILANAYHASTQPGDTTNPMNYEKRMTTALYATFCSVIVLCVLILVRFTVMSNCEGTWWLAYVISILFGLLSAGIGVGLYDLSVRCGARSSDMLGILSQIVPASASSPSPTVCMAQD